MNDVLAIVGMGYVGLPVAVAFGRTRKVIGFDISVVRVEELGRGVDRTGEASTEELAASHYLEFTNNREDLRAANVFIVCVPTPIDAHNAPDLEPLVQATRDVGRAIEKGSLVVYESTVYPGVTDETCVPILEEASGLKVNEDFWVGYSPERINPGDPTRRFETIVKVVSGSCDHALNLVDELYSSVVTAGTYRAPSIKVAEAAKVIENTQRDLNIALINELSQIFNLLDIDTHEVLAAASTKWNFLPFQPGLVGGHCIGVDPYYLTHRAEQIGCKPEVILAGRAINDSMGSHVADRVLALVKERGVGEVINPRILILGATFKENCPDIRNSRAIDIYNELKQFGLDVDVYDPHANYEEVKHEYGIELVDNIDIQYDAIILAVSHDQFLTLDFKKMRNGHNTIIFDTKACLDRNLIDARL